MTYRPSPREERESDRLANGEDTVYRQQLRAAGRSKIHLASLRWSFLVCRAEKYTEIALILRHRILSLLVGADGGLPKGEGSTEIPPPAQTEPGQTL
jgi:hypothetical protein